MRPLLTRTLTLAALLTLCACTSTVYPEVDDGVGEPGPHPVAIAPIPDVRARLFYPVAEAERPTPAAAGLPLLVLFPGFAAETAAYDGTSAHLASHGFAVLAVEHDFGFVSALLCETQADGRARVATILDRALAHLEGEDAGELRGVVEGQALITLGHSYGGKLAFWTALEDARVAGVFTFDPVDGGDEGRRPDYCPSAPEGFPAIAPRTGELAAIPLVAIEAGKAGECAPAAGNASVFIAAAEGPARKLVLPGAGHADFVDPALEEECAACDFCPGSEVDAAEVQRLTRGALLAFARSVLVDEEAPEVALEAVDAWLSDAGFDEGFCEIVG